MMGLVLDGVEILKESDVFESVMKENWWWWRDTVNFLHSSMGNGKDGGYTGEDLRVLQSIGVGFCWS